MPLKDTITNIVTGGAYEKPAKTVDGAFTKQGEPNAHTIEGTSADPNSTGSKAGDLLEQGKDKAQQAKGEAEKQSGKDTSQMKNEVKGEAQKAKGEAQKNL